MNSIQCDIAIKNFEKYESKLERLSYIREYYNKRSENDFVGIIDKNISNRKKSIKGEGDIFKIRSKLSKSDKKRGLNITSFKGAVCNAKPKDEIDIIALSLGIKNNELNDSRINICEKIKNKLLDKEINSKEDKTFIIIPANHPKYNFPLNILDRKK
jgi:hypothetical protein